MFTLCGIVVVHKRCTSILCCVLCALCMPSLLPTPPSPGADLFISVWNLHHSPYLWKDPDTFRPERFEEVHTNPDFGDKWAGEGEGGPGVLGGGTLRGYVRCWSTPTTLQGLSLRPCWPCPTLDPQGARLFQHTSVSKTPLMVHGVACMAVCPPHASHP